MVYFVLTWSIIHRVAVLHCGGLLGLLVQYQEMLRVWLSGEN